MGGGGVGKCATKEHPKSDLDLDLGFVNLQFSLILMATMLPVNQNKKRKSTLFEDVQPRIWECAPV